MNKKEKENLIGGLLALGISSAIGVVIGLVFKFLFSIF